MPDNAPHTLLLEPNTEPELLAGLNKLADRLNWMLDAPEARDMPQRVAETGILEEIGRRLWASARLDAKDLLEKIEEAKEAKTVLRLVVTGQETYHLPWELLYHDHAEIGFLGRHPWCAMVRRVRGKGKTQPMQSAWPLRILLFVASPEDLDPEKTRLDYEREEELLFTALDRPLAEGKIQIDVAQEGYLSTLLAKLGSQHFHAVILSMHGVRARNARGEEEWGLLFEDEETWLGRPVAGSSLAAELEKTPVANHPGLIVLSACRSARGEGSAAAIPDVALQLHQKGFERVLGMRLSVLDGAASAFNAELFHLIAGGDSLGRAVSLARARVASGGYVQGGMGTLTQDPFAQWTLPVLLDRTTDGPLVDLKAGAKLLEHPPMPTVLPGDGTVTVPSRAAFIGRRAVIRQHLKPFLDGKSRHLLFTGPGGVGKTTMAGLFARHLMDQNTGNPILGFKAPFRPSSVYEPMRQAAFDGPEEKGLGDRVGCEQDERRRISLMLASLARRRPLTLVLDNLETLQDLKTLDFLPEHQESRWFLEEALALPAPTRVLLTGRYAIDGRGVSHCSLGDAPYGDILRRMNRLEWPSHMEAKDKRRIYEVLGGNHRAIEWTACLLTQKAAEAAELMAALEKVKAPPNTADAAAATVAEAMRQNLLFDRLLGQLSPTQERLLRAAALYRVPVNADGLRIVETEREKHEENRSRLQAYSLLEEGLDRAMGLTYYMVPPVVAALLGPVCFEAPVLKILHEQMARYHRGQGAFVSRRWQDDLEAIHHFRRAEAHEEADELAENVSAFYHLTGGVTRARDLVQEIVGRDEPPAPWWALNRYGMCQHSLGFYEEALEAHLKSLETCPGSKERGTTLNNISQIYDARGDYDTALKYLEQSLKIRREIGDKAGEGATLNNISQIYKARGDYDTALKYLEQSLKIRREIGDKAGTIPTLHNMAHIALGA
ncbi:MAG: tetratricopeptide repeat protein, partial [Thermodesulfobacteriota bacterium]